MVNVNSYVWSAGVTATATIYNINPYVTWDSYYTQPQPKREKTAIEILQDETDNWLADAI